MSIPIVADVASGSTAASFFAEKRAARTRNQTGTALASLKVAANAWRQRVTRAARTLEMPAAAADANLHPLGKSSTYHWKVNDTLVDMSMPLPEPRRATIACEPQSIVVDLNRTALIVIDMQNDFCAKGGWVDHLGVDYTPDRAPIGPLQKLLPPLRKASVPIIWVNWGNRPDLLNMPPNQIHLYKPHGVGIGLGELLPGSGARVLEKDSWAAAVVDELKPQPGDVMVDKYRISGFWDTPLDSCSRISARARFCLPGSTLISAYSARSPMPIFSATAASCSRTAAPPPRRSSARRHPSGTSRNATAS
jgi:Isochorismatase family